MWVTGLRKVVTRGATSSLPDSPLADIDYHLFRNHILNLFSFSTVPSCVLANLGKMPGEIRFARLRRSAANAPVHGWAVPPPTPNTHDGAVEQKEKKKKLST